MKRILILLFILCTGCASERYQRSKNFDRKSLVNNLYQLLKNKDIDQATPYLFYLRKPENDIENQLFAQYHLLACNPKKSLIYVEQIDNPLDKKIFKTVIAGMVTLERPEKFQKKTFRRKKNSEKTKDLVFNVDVEEIWPDEWQAIRPAKKTRCHNLPLATADYKKYLNEYSKNKMISLPQEVFKRDFSLLALGVDLGFPFKEVGPLLSHYQNNKDNFYYQYLEKLGKEEGIEKEKRELEEDEVKTKSDENMISISTLSFKRRIFNPRAIDIPFLVRKPQL